ncbi:uncharacterized protein LOC122570432 isoform X2 [Bombus pyrosoma]|uniref:uncharacterized protein LOC122570432 isoform X2 n=1 Tax=Bombus pyrosoma TaxID=396416 RepID=UPI001CB9290C|nr:uncharacterized protein LOC122570432 isoform X2 [Bombus pyrosoma]
MAAAENQTRCSIVVHRPNHLHTHQVGHFARPFHRYTTYTHLHCTCKALIPRTSLRKTDCDISTTRLRKIDSDNLHRLPRIRIKHSINPLYGPKFIAFIL